MSKQYHFTSVISKGKFKKRYCHDLIRHMRTGLSYVTFAATIHVTEFTIYGWEKHHPEWLNAKNLAVNECRLYWERVGCAGAVGGMKVNPALWSFNMRNRFGWRDAPPSTININTFGDEERKALQEIPESTLQSIDRFKNSVLPRRTCGAFSLMSTPGVSATVNGSRRRIWSICRSSSAP